MKKGNLFRRFSAVFMLVLMTVVSAGCKSPIVLDPKGPVGQQQMDLIVISTLLCLVIIVPVLVITFVIVWRYRDKPDRKAKYTPNWEHSTKLETIWWGIPILIILVLGVVTVRYTHALEPSKPLAAEKEVKPITIQVTSLDWKWLFKYPEQGIATVNYVQFPEDVPVRFELTSDAPMNSFWIPQLGGQIYTMSGMAMKLNLMADEPGEYMGSGANFSGKDFGKMRFVAKATTQADFDSWVKEIKGSSPELTLDGYKKLAEPGVSEVQSFSKFPEGLFEKIVTRYSPSHNHGGFGAPVPAKPSAGTESGTSDKAAGNSSTEGSGAVKQEASAAHTGHE
ncbi:ubiquinol oxidase subunit II [Paenibacillus chitinolyticus]|uniref:Quinol oxidase subunit 2 n=1 Tax=Paenibacillus chitinolyticus TaxID=79263 RepID=A0A410WUM6_9BACL|nr:ubiquinol oxidase subunit II [Paenibacillus chitinolyticus]MCY9594101.1 ubiquinol oxidase subunit II [Paenibacillus chitinolyticus]MCY9596186.1 ubiquinol oxidase subunit II [Paenibacillus chitinolyticus]QAV18085.1 ubiquinol oxidase subunit II [Paenibacillus chitinolyticus]